MNSFWALGLNHFSDPVLEPAEFVTVRDRLGLGD